MIVPSNASTRRVALDFVPGALYRRKDSISVIVEDNEAIGRLGAEHLMSLGNLASIGFVPDVRNRGWSRIRERAFARCVGDAGKKARIYRADKQPLGKWLKELPKPAAVMAAFDFRAKEVLDACTDNALKVPEQVAVLGVDNDRLLCENSSPPLSSIEYDEFAPRDLFADSRPHNSLGVVEFGMEPFRALFQKFEPGFAEKYGIGRIAAPLVRSHIRADAFVAGGGVRIRQYSSQTLPHYQ